MFNKFFFYNHWFSKLFNYNFTYNCCFYNFYIENNFLFFKITDTYKSFFYSFLSKFFKKRVKKIRIIKFKNKNPENPENLDGEIVQPQPQVPKKKKKFVIFRFRKKRFKFKKLRKHFKSFFLKESSPKNEKLLDLNFFYFFYFLIKLIKIKKIKIKRKELNKFNFCFFENFFLKKLLILKKQTNIIFQKNNLNNTIFIKSNHYFKFFKFFYFFKKTNYSNFLRKSFFKVNFKKIRRFKNFKKTQIKLYKFKFIINYKNIFSLYNNFYSDSLYKINFLFGFFFFEFICIYNLNSSKKFFRIKKNKRFKRIKRRFSIKSKFLKTKKKYRYKYRYIFYNKLNARKNSLLFKKNLYKFILINLYNSFKLKFSFFNFNFLNKYNYYFYFFLKNQKNSINYFFKKKLFFFDFLKKNKNNKNFIYNNQYPIYNSNKKVLKIFKKIFKSHFNKKLNNNLYFYVIPLFEFVFNKNILIKSSNSNIFKNLKIRKKFFKKKLLKIFKKNKFSVLSRSVNFNLHEVIEVIIHSFYYKDIYFLLNWFIKNFNKTHFTHHRNFLVLFHTIMNDIFESYRGIFQIKGFYYTLKGKVGVTSNAKKKTIRFKIGSSKKSQKSQKMDFQQGVVKSLSGSIGVSMILTY